MTTSIKDVEARVPMPPMRDDELSNHRIKLLEEELKRVRERSHEVVNEMAKLIAQSEADRQELNLHRAECAKRDAEKRTAQWQVWLAMFGLLLTTIGGIVVRPQQQPQQPPIVNVTVPKDSIKVVLPTKVLPGGS